MVGIHILHFTYMHGFIFCDCNFCDVSNPQKNGTTTENTYSMVYLVGFLNPLRFVTGVLKRQLLVHRKITNLNMIYSMNNRAYWLHTYKSFIYSHTSNTDKTNFSSTVNKIHCFNVISHMLPKCPSTLL